MLIRLRSVGDSEWHAVVGIMHRAFADQPFAREIYGEDRLVRWARAYDDYVAVRREHYAVALGAFAGAAPVGVVLGSLPGACRACDRVAATTTLPDPVAVVNREFERNVAAVHAAQPPHGWISKLAVEPGLRGLGVGRSLLEAAVAALPAGAPVLLECEPHREAFYVAAGFRRVTTFADPAGPDASLLCRDAP